MYPASRSIINCLFFLLLSIPFWALTAKETFPVFTLTGFIDPIIYSLELLFVLFAFVFIPIPKLNKEIKIIIVSVSLWHVSGFASAYFGASPFPSLLKQTEYVIHSMFLFSIWLLASRTYIAPYLIISLHGTFWAIVASMAIKWAQLENPHTFNWNRALPLFSNIRHMTYFLVAIFAFLYIPLISNHRKLHWIIYALVALSAYWGLLFWSSSRAAALASLIICIFICITYRRLHGIVVLSILSIGIGWIFAIWCTEGSNVLNPYRILGFPPITLESGKELFESESRWLIWMKTLNYFWESNPVFGLGANSFQYSPLNIKEPISHPHNLLIQLITQHGVIGFLMLGGIVLYSLKNWTKKSSKKELTQIIGMVSLATITGAALVDGHYHHTQSLIIIFIALSIAIIQQQSSEVYYSKTSITVSSIQTSLIGLIFIGLIVFVNIMHWRTYAAMQLPLTNSDQIEQVEAFPSYFNYNSWSTSFTAGKELRHKAIHLGALYARKKCKFLRLDAKLHKDSESFLEKDAYAINNCTYDDDKKQ